MDSLKLGLIGLPEAEGRLIATLFRLHRVAPSFIWTLKSGPPFDALLVDAATHQDEISPHCGLHTRIMRLSLPGAQVEGELSRPIRSDLLVAWLNSIEVGLLHGGHDAFAPTAGLSRFDGPPSQATHTTPAAPTEPSVAPIAPLSQAVAPPLSDDAEALVIYKLRRWPSAAVLEKNVSLIRVATLLSRKALSLKELVSVSRVDEALCEAFLKNLGKHNLLLIERRPITASAPEPGDAVDQTQNHSPYQKKGIGALGVIRSIRRRFGLL